jgi:hypothetical protein
MDSSKEFEEEVEAALDQGHNYEQLLEYLEKYEAIEPGDAYKAQLEMWGIPFERPLALTIQVKQHLDRKAQALATISAAHHKASQELVREAYNDVWQSFKQQYSGTQWEAEMEPWLRSFVVAANITPDILKQEGEKHE